MESVFAIALIWLSVAFIFALIKICAMVGQAAFKKNRGFWAFFWFSIFLSPVLMALIVAILPFSSADPRNPENIRLMDSGKAQQFEDLSILGGTRKFLLILGAVLSGLVLIVGIFSSASRGIDSTIEKNSTQSSSLPNGTPLQNEVSKVLEKAVQENCQGITGDLFTIENSDKGANYYSVVAPNKYGVFQVVKYNDGWMISSIFTPWNCKKTIIID